MLSAKLDAIFNQAVKKGNQKKHEYLTLELVLLSLVEDDDVASVIYDCDGDTLLLKKELNSFLDNDENFSILSEESIEQLNKLHFESDDIRKMAKSNGILYRPELSLAVQRCLQRAAIHLHSSGKSKIECINLFVALFDEKESYAVYLLEKQNLSKSRILEIVAHGVDQAKNYQELETESDEDEETESDSMLKGKKNPNSAEKILQKYTVNLNQQIKDGRIDPIIGRTKELQRIIQILCRKNKSNPLFVGDSGVGKTALAYGLAWAIHEKRVPPFLEDTIIYSLDVAALMAGTRYRGDFEERLKALVGHLVGSKDSIKKNILFIDEIHNIIGAGATNGGSLDISNILKPALSFGDLKCMGSTTYEEFKKFLEKDSALIRRFQKIDIHEPSMDDTYKILEGIKQKFEEHHKIKYPSSIIKLTVDLSCKHLSDRKLPDKAIDVIDEVGSFIQLKKGSKRKIVGNKDIEEVISIMAKIPKKSVSGNEKNKLKNLEEELRNVIFGQDEAVSKVVNSIWLSRSGLGHIGRPISTFLFSGPTGVGKTELTKQLAFHLGVHFERFDMSEFMEKHSVSKLIGAPPGYVGYDNGGTLTDAINKHPYCVLLLDEIEKAHIDVYNILLQVMDHGVLTDSTGKTIDFKNVILVMTTNAGSNEMEAGQIGFSISYEQEFKREKAIKNFFSPEFRNRLDAIIHFSRLSIQNIEMIVEKFLKELQDQLDEKGIYLSVSDEVKKWLSTNGLDKKLGARPIGRIINDKIKKNLAKEILFGKLEKGGKVFIELKQDELCFKFESKRN